MTVNSVRQTSWPPNRSQTGLNRLELEVEVGFEVQFHSELTGIGTTEAPLRQQQTLALGFRYWIAELSRCINPGVPSLD